MDTDKTLPEQMSEKVMAAKVGFFNPCPSVPIRGY
jgi:hypothetical protein